MRPRSLEFELLMMVDTENRYNLFFQMGFDHQTIVNFNLNQSPAACWCSCDEHTRNMGKHSVN